MEDAVIKREAAALQPVGTGQFSFETGTAVNDMANKTSHIGRVIPGYTGHLPHRKEHVGQTFGQGGQASFDTYKEFIAKPPVLHDQPSIDSQRQRFLNESAHRDNASGARNFVPAWRLADFEGEARHKEARALGTHARAPYGVDRIDEPYGRVHYQTMSQTGPGAFFVKKEAERRKMAMESTLGAAMDIAGIRRASWLEAQAAAATGAEPTSGSLASQIAHRRLSKGATR